MSGYVTAVPTVTFGPNGFQAPADPAIFAGVQTDINNAFGGQLSTNQGTAQYQQATSESAIISDANATMIQLFNGVDPAFAAGRMQDAIGRIYFITRLPATSTVAQVVCSGLTGVTILLGALITAQDGNQYQCTQQGEIGATGSVTLPFACVATGPIACPAQTFTITQTIFGWDTAVSSVAGAIGDLVESRAAFELRRQNTVANNALGTLDAVLAAVLLVAGVLDAYVMDNPSNSSETVGGVTLAANSLYVCVAGGLATAVALAIWQKKPPGCPYTGNTTITVTDPNPAYTTPPSYSVTFQTATNTDVWFLVTLVNSTSVPSTVNTQVQNAIISGFSGADGGSRARIGSTIYALRYSGDIIGLGSWVSLISIQIGLTNAISVTGTISGTTLTVTAVSGGSLAVGTWLSNSSYAPFEVTALGSGTGGTGTYTITTGTAATTGSTVFGGITFGSSVTMGISQEPVIAAGQITVILQ
jgi:hypothetical protein